MENNINKDILTLLNELLDSSNVGNYEKMKIKKVIKNI